MSFLSFLKKAGQVLANVASVEAGLEPIFKAALPAAAGATVDKLDLIFKSVVATEGMFATAFPTGQTGPQKLLAASSLIGPVLSTVDTVTGKPIADEAALVAAIQKITGGVADYMNALQAKPDASTTAGAIPAPAAAVSQIKT
jgi:hypothetical protein